MGWRTDAPHERGHHSRSQRHREEELHSWWEKRIAALSDINTMVMLVLADLNRRAADASVIVRADDAERTLHIEKGKLVFANSNVRPERLGDMLAREGRLDPVLIEPVAAEARRRGTLLGDQLIADGLLTPTELASALERQVVMRFDAAVAMPGEVTLAARGPGAPSVRLELGNAVMALFRERLALEPIESLLADRDRGSVALDLDSEPFKRLQLVPVELRTARRLAAGETLDDILGATGSPEQVLRLAGALAGLGLWA